MANYCTAAELKAEIQLASSSDDTHLEDVIIPGVSNLIDRYCNRPDGFIADASASARTYSGSGDTIQWIDECVEVSLVEVKDSPSDATYTSWASADWIACAGNPEYPDYNRTPYRFIIVSSVGDYEVFTSGQYTGLKGFRRGRLKRRGVPTVRITAKWGYSVAAPPIIKQACIAQAARYYKRGKSAWADTTANSTLGAMNFRTNVGSGLDPDIRVMLDGGRFKKPTLGKRY